MNIYELLQSEDENITTEIACIEISLQTFVKLGKITNDQRITFLKSLHCGERISNALKKYNNFIRDMQ